MRKYLLRGAAVLLVLYLLFVGVMFTAMKRSPAEFSRFMMNVPMPLMMATPFPPLWNKARAGTLKNADLAPDFDLAASDHKSRIRLSEFRGSRPVVLVFGSYT